MSTKFDYQAWLSSGGSIKDIPVELRQRIRAADDASTNTEGDDSGIDDLISKKVNDAIASRDQASAISALRVELGESFSKHEKQAMEMINRGYSPRDAFKLAMFDDSVKDAAAKSAEEAQRVAREKETSTVTRPSSGAGAGAGQKAVDYSDKKVLSDKVKELSGMKFADARNVLIADDDLRTKILEKARADNRL